MFSLALLVEPSSGQVALTIGADWCSFCIHGQTIAVCVFGFALQFRVDCRIFPELFRFDVDYEERHPGFVSGIAFGRPRAC